jgi:hypothetical protein
MIRKRLKYLACSAVLLMTVSGLAGCGNTSTTSAVSATSATAAADLFAKLTEYSSEDLDASWDETSATQIALNGSSAAIEGSGAAVAGSKVTITAAGTYVLSGTLSDGQIIVAAGEKDQVRLVLNEVTLACSSSAPLYTKQADKTIITLASGTTNRVTDGSTYNHASGEDEPDATIFSTSDLTVNGAGTLTVAANYNNGIGTKDDLVITGGTINIIAANDGLRGRDSVQSKTAA